jgi:hypothetical protein
MFCLDLRVKCIGTLFAHFVYFICPLQILDKGRFSKTDYYVDHAVTDAKTTLLVTDRRLVLMSHDLFGQWQVGLLLFIILFVFIWCIHGTAFNEGRFYWMYYGKSPFYFTDKYRFKLG